MKNIICIKNNNVNSVCFALLIKTPKDDLKPGIAHLMEHMAFRKAGEFNQKDIYHISESLGVNLNAATYKGYIKFEFICRKEVFEQIISLFAKMFYEIDYDNAMFESEKRVVCAEIRQRYYSYAEEIINSLWENKKYRQSILSTEDHIDKITTDDLISFKKKVIDNCKKTIFLMGNYSNNDKNVVEKLFENALYKEELSFDKTLTDRPIHKINFSQVRSDTYLVYYAFHMNCSHENKLNNFLMIKIIDEILFRGNNAYLKASLREDEGLIYEFESYQEILDNEIVYLFGFEVSHKYIIKAIEVLEKAIKEFVIEEKYIQYVKAFYCYNYDINYDNFLNVFYDYIDNLINFDEVISPKELSAKIAEITKEKVANYFRQLFDKKEVFVIGNLNKKLKKEIHNSLNL